MKAEALYVSPEGIFKVITKMPKEPNIIDCQIIGFGKPNSTTAASLQKLAYQQALSKAKEEAIEVKEQGEGKMILLKALNWNPHPDEHRFEKDTIYPISGYEFRIETFTIYDLSDQPSGYEELAILTPSSLNNSSEEEQKRYSFDQMMDFVTWYSGMERTKVISAYARYLREANKKPV